MSNFREALTELLNQGPYIYDPGHCVHDLLGAKKVILYGGGHGFITFSTFVLEKYEIKATAVIDRKFERGDTCFGIPAFSPADYTPTGDEKQSAVVVITVGKTQFHGEILRYLRELGFQNIILATDIYEYHLLHPTPEVEEKGHGYYLENAENIMKCLDLFSDDVSREIFTRFIQTHMQRVPIPIPSRLVEEQYFPTDLTVKKGYSRFVNCGAYNGDTIMQLNTLFGKVEAVACFEPDQKNFGSLAEYVCTQHAEIAREVILFPCGVFSHETYLPFKEGNASNSMISDKGESLIQCVAMDHVIPGFRPTFITMDVEGVELNALKGAEGLIKDNIPDLAICVYHAPGHVWEIPLYIHSLHPDYELYLRNYTSFASETVLYATA